MSELFYKIHPVLPVFIVPSKQGSVLYTAGYQLLVKDDRDRIESLISRWPDYKPDELQEEMILLLQKAEENVKAYTGFISSPPGNDCLTIHTGTECNRKCKYCFASRIFQGDIELNGFPDRDAVQEVFRFMIRSRDNKRPFTVVYHGSGEPTYHFKELIECHDLLRQIAGREKISMRSYIATNGGMSNEVRAWIAGNIDITGISCDGPPEINSLQRPGGNDDYDTVEEFCRELQQKGRKYEIRATITRRSMQHLVGIVDYFIKNLKATTIRIEPVYLSETESFTREDADTFFMQYKAAAALSSKHGGSLSYAGVRHGEIHSTYCDTLRNTLRINPFGITGNCFIHFRDESRFLTGRYDSDKNKFTPDPEISKTRMESGRIPRECFKCINVLHCSRGCPDFCIHENVQLNAFRCRLHKLITTDYVLKNAGCQES